MEMKGIFSIMNWSELHIIFVTLVWFQPFSQRYADEKTNKFNAKVFTVIIMTLQKGEVSWTVVWQTANKHSLRIVLILQCPNCYLYDVVSKSFRTDRLARQLQIVHLSATRCSCIAILSVSLVSFAAITVYVASQRVFIVVSVYFVIDSVRKRLDTLSYTSL
jgi:hypothetical protein